MAYPLMSLYNDAIQNPKINIKDIELNGCNVEKTPWDLPKVASGGFALTYKLNSARKSWAVRCFHKEVPDLQQRYSKISSFLKQTNCIYFTKFEYISEGIRVNNAYFPIVKMDWLNGTPLNIYIENNLNNTSKLDNLLSNFKKCITELEKIKVAHGDLQHGNILLVNDEIKLIDYDGMFVPNIGFSKSNELGHVNFQHPLRDETHYNQSIDRFSAIVIYLAIKALREMPSLWKKYDYGENILFKRDDFINPENSLLINQLKTINSLSTLVNNFIKLCKVRYESIPSLDNFINGNYVIQASEFVSNATGKPVRRRQYKLINAIMKDELLNHVGDVIEVVGQITKVHWGKTKYHNESYAILNFGDYRANCFRIPIWKEGLSLLWKNGIDLNSYDKRWISVTGLISNFSEAPQIIYDNSVKINLLKNEKEAIELLKETSIAVIDIKPRKSNSEILKNISSNYMDDSNPRMQMNTAHVPAKTKNQALLAQIQKKPNITANVTSRTSNQANASTPNQQIAYSNMQNQGNQNNPNNKSSKNCFIATEVYGNPDILEVRILRRWRDEFLLKYSLGQKSVNFYYKNSPKLVKKIKNKPKIKNLIKCGLDLFIRLFLRIY